MLGWLMLPVVGLERSAQGSPLCEGVEETFVRIRDFSFCLDADGELCETTSGDVKGCGGRSLAK